MAPSALASFVADIEHLLDDPNAVGVRLRALLSQDDWLPAAHRVLDGDACRQHSPHVSPSHRLSVVVLIRLRTTTAIGDRPAISIHVCGTKMERRLGRPPASWVTGDVRHALVTPRVVEVTRAGRPWTRPEPPGASTAISGSAQRAPHDDH